MKIVHAGRQRTNLIDIIGKKGYAPTAMRPQGEYPIRSNGGKLCHVNSPLVE